MTAGAPFVSGAKVLGVVDGESRGPKVRVFKKKRRKGFRKQAGYPRVLHEGPHHRNRRVAANFSLSTFHFLLSSISHGS